MMHSQYQINLIVRRMANHAGPSGYDRLAEFIPGRRIVPIQRRKTYHRIIVHVFRMLIARSNAQWYRRDSLYQELTAAWRWIGGPKKIFHFLYGENSYRYLGLMKHVANHKIVCTYHTPPEKFVTVVRNRDHLKHVDLAVVVSRSQLDFFSDVIGPEKVVFIPHGIDTQYFTPALQPGKTSETLRCLFVGTHLRDFETLAEAANLMNHRGLKFSLNVVTADRYHDRFRSIENVTCLSDISDDMLLSLYRQSDVLLFPLTGSTANNTLLEAMACGLPIITTRIDGVQDYVAEDCAMLTPMKSASSIVEAVSALKENPAFLTAMAQAGRLRALQFSWPRIAEKTRDLYDVL